MGFLSGKRILITGVASKRSIAWGIAKAMHQQGAELAFSYQKKKLQSRIENFAKELKSNIVLLCDVSSDKNIKFMFNELKNFWKNFDGFVHAVAFAPIDQLDGDYLTQVSREGFITAHEISSYSFAAMAKESCNMLNEQSSLLTLSYLGAEKVILNYNVMGLAKASLEANVRYMANSLGKNNIRVNGISAGPIRTLAASGIKNFKKMLSHFQSVTPLKRNVTIEDIGNVAAFLCSNLANGITGEIIHVDNGYNIVSINQLNY
ncbi:SDR family oxidoreductase [Candidatus Tachikawaea gelatinosa]|uniref:Enoyl-[acyl-carrier-protein] reductase [NADH] n=1 Tax=Candidatus Tachikawaea gelatinosa TaxID=1410383 RepID=A0A090AL46_9ENTR|nr:SDR family oxidoreductase [Candidatus Tachikawaea gelatinosa]BAP58309.1 enoyl-[acyl-carrier-protein] reductase [NADH] [Candidatus Tachikawaea gelatinosa]